MSISSISSGTSSPADPRTSCVAVETLDLQCACPIWPTFNSDSALLRRIFGLRERWSYSNVLISGPQTIGEVDLERRRGDLHTMLQVQSHWLCLSKLFWRAIGPPELMEDLRGKSEGTQNRWSRAIGQERFVAAVPMSLLLCQHEIRGD